MNKKDLVTYSIWGGVFLLVLLWSDSLAESAAYWPRMICIIGLILSLIGIMRCGIALLNEKKNTRESIFVLNKVQAKRASVLLITMIMWIILIKSLGFLVSSFITINFIVIYFEALKSRKKILLDLGITSILVVGMYFLFVILGVRFPLGILG